MQEHIKVQQAALEKQAATIPCLQLHFIVSACQDPGPAIASLLVLPALAERIHAKASIFKTSKAASSADQVSNEV